MVRTPCCEKMGLKKGPWTQEEDQILISHVQQYGHGNWRALPKQAGLLRCGKSCRLRWINYLRPDIKRGKFSNEEVDTILELHEVLGNRWSTIAARLPGRTDNEIKNFWHTHLKRRERSTMNTSSYPLQETSGSGEATGKLLIANDGLSSRRNYSPAKGHGTVSVSDISGEKMASDVHSENGEEMEFWYNLFRSSHHKGMEI